MLVPDLRVYARDSGISPQGCRPLSLSSSVCVGDLIAIIACSIAGLGFIFWSIHVIRKIRNDPLDDLTEEDNYGVDPSTSDHSIPVQHGVGMAQIPSYPDRVRTRLALSQTEEDYYRFTNPVTNEMYSGRAPMKPPGMPRRSIPAGRPCRHQSLVRYSDGRYDHDMCGPGATSKVDGPPQARGSPPPGYYDSLTMTRPTY